MSNEANQSISVTVNNINDKAPILTNEDNVSVDENQLNAITLTATDEDGDIDTLTYSICDTCGSDTFDINSSTRCNYI